MSLAQISTGSTKFAKDNPTPWRLVPLVQDVHCNFRIRLKMDGFNIPDAGYREAE